MLAISYTRVQLLKSACAQVQEKECAVGSIHQLSQNLLSYWHNIPLWKVFQANISIMDVWERLHKMGCGFIVYRRCLFGTTAEHLGQVEQGEEIIGYILFHPI